MKKIVIALAVLALCSLSIAQTPTTTNTNQQKEAAAAPAQPIAALSATQSPFAIDKCAFNFSSGHAESFLKYCVTENGNIIQFETPKGREHLLFAANGTVGEGYGICDIQAGEYFDYAEFGDSGNWNPARVVHQDVNSVEIARATRDGIWTLTQTITQVPGTSPFAKIAMKIKNHTDAPRTLVVFRYANANADGVLNNNLDSTVESAFGWNENGRSPQVGFGLMLQNAGPTPFPHTGFKLNVPDPPQPCNAFAHFVKGPLTNTDGSLGYDYALTIDQHSAKTVTVAYRGM